MTEDARLACRVLAGLPRERRSYEHLVSALAKRFPAQADGLRARPRAVQAIYQAMVSGWIQRLGDRLMSLAELEEEMDG